MLRACNQLCAELISCGAAASTGALRWYAIATSGERPRSTLRGDVGLEFVFGRHQDAAELYAEAIREAVVERLSVAGGSRRSRNLDLAMLKELPPADLADACHLAKLQLQPHSDAGAMAAALHDLLHSSQFSASTAAAAGPRPAARQDPTLPPLIPLQRADWRGLSSETDATDASIASQRPSVGAMGAMANSDDEEAAMAQAAEREADELFGEELQRRLVNAAAGGAAGGGVAGTGATGAPSAAAAGLAYPAAARPAAPLPPSSLSQAAVGPAKVPPPAAAPQAGPATAPERPSDLGPLFPGLLRTTEMMAASAAGAGGGSTGHGAMPGALSSPYDPVASTAHPTEVLRAVRRRLARMGYSGKDPVQLRSLLLLSRRDLQELVQDFSGGDPARQQDLPDPDTSGLLGREQLAMRLLQLLGQRTGAAQEPPQRHHDDTQQGTQPPEEPQQVQPEHVLPAVPEHPPQPSQLQHPTQQVQHLGDPRRREVLEAAARRRELMAAAARPEEIASWLVKARAQDVLMIHIDSKEEVDSHDERTAVRASASATASGSGSGASVVIATGLSQRHAYACAEAVRYQIRERIEELASAAEPTGQPGSSPGRLPRPWVPGPPAVSGANGGDWLSLEAGPVQVHVLTPQARRYYRLEDIFISRSEPYGSRSGSRQGSHAGPGGWRQRVRLFGPAAGERQPETLETARVTGEHAGERP